MQMVQDRTLMGRYGNSIMQSNTGPEYFSGYCSQQCTLYIVGWENFWPGQMLLRIWENWEKKCKFAKKTLLKKQWFLSPSFFAKLTTLGPCQFAPKEQPAGEPSKRGSPRQKYPIYDDLTKTNFQKMRSLAADKRVLACWSVKGQLKFKCHGEEFVRRVPCAFTPTEELFKWTQ